MRSLPIVQLVSKNTTQSNSEIIKPENVGTAIWTSTYFRAMDNTHDSDAVIRSPCVQLASASLA